MFLGYTRKDTDLIKFLRARKCIVVENGQKHLFLKDIKNYDLILSYGYRKLIKKKFLDILPRPPINLHLSYLPYNKGSHPNYWSFKEKTPAGISIHEVDSGIDTGRVIFRKKIKFKNNQKLTLQNTYASLKKEMMKLFVYNFKKILNNNYKSFKPLGKGTFHKKKELPKAIKNWDKKISEI